MNLTGTNMKILYAIQGTGNGHVSRARDIIPILRQKGDVDILISGTQADVDLPFPVEYRFKGLSFIFGEKGGVDLLETYKKSRLRRLVKEIASLPVEKYHLIISDFEPVSAWACYLKNKPCIALSHQAAVIDKSSPQAKHIDPVGRSILKRYAPASVQYGFHFKAYNEHIFTPVIRRQIREIQPENRGHYTVYLPAYSDKRIIRVLSECKDVRWEVFSKHNKEKFSSGNIDVYPIHNDHFIQSMATAEGVLCGAGFETPAEALYLGKKLLVIPMKNQFEQHCNSAALQSMGVPVMKSLKLKRLDSLTDWLLSTDRISVDYPDITEELIDRIIKTHQQDLRPSIAPSEENFTVKTLTSLTLKKIIARLAG